MRSCDADDDKDSDELIRKLEFDDSEDSEEFFPCLSFQSDTETVTGASATAFDGDLGEGDRDDEVVGSRRPAVPPGDCW